MKALQSSTRVAGSFAQTHLFEEEAGGYWGCFLHVSFHSPWSRGVVFYFILFVNILCCCL